MFYIIILLIILILASFAYAAHKSIGWVPIWSKDIDKVMELADIKSGQKFCDLGCGEGKVVLAAAKKGAKATGYELAIIMYLIARLRVFFSKNKADIKFKDFWSVDLSNMDIVFFFLIPNIYPRMKNKFQKELKPGSKVIAYVWPFKDWEPEKVVQRHNGPAIYLYIIK